jgi:tetratricopeptide (TPR) repeat protein
MNLHKAITMPTFRNRLFPLLAVLLATAFAAGSVLAQEKKKDNDFPNATREEPKTSISPKAVRKVNSAYALIDDGEYDRAKLVLEEVLNEKRASPFEKALALNGLSNIAWEEDDVVNALEYNKQAVALDALDNKAQFNAIYQTAQMNLMEENYDDALAAVDQWMKLSGSETADAWALKGNTLYRLDRFDESGAAMERAISLSTTPSDTWIQILIASYTDQEKYPEAAKAAEGLLAKNPNNKSVLLQLSNIYVDMEQEDKALALLESAYQKGQLSEARELRQLYQMYNYLEKPDRAAAVINEGIAKGTLKPDYDTYKGLGDAYSLAEDFDKAIDAYTKAAPMARDGEMDFQRGQLLIQEKDRFAEGKAAIQAAFAKGVKREGEAWILLGNAEYGLDNTAAAIAAYEKARAFPSTKTMAETWLKSARQR